MSQCEPIQHHGDGCTEDIQCVMSGDPNLHCIDFSGGGKEKKCQCRRGFVMVKDKCNLEPQRPNHIKVKLFLDAAQTESRINSYYIRQIKKMNPKQNGNSDAVEIQKNLTRLYNSGDSKFVQVCDSD